MPLELSPSMQCLAGDGPLLQKTPQACCLQTLSKHLQHTATALVSDTLDCIQTKADLLIVCYAQHLAGEVLHRAFSAGLIACMSTHMSCGQTEAKTLTCNASDPACLAFCISWAASCQCTNTLAIMCLLCVLLTCSSNWRRCCLSATPSAQELIAVPYCLLAQNVRALRCLAPLTADAADHDLHCCKAEDSRTKLR